MKQKIIDLINQIAIVEVTHDGEFQHAKLCEKSVDAYAQKILETVRKPGPKVFNFHKMIENGETIYLCPNCNAKYKYPDYNKFATNPCSNCDTPISEKFMKLLN